MKHHLIRRSLIILSSAALLPGAPAFAADAGSELMIMNTEQTKWTAGPPFLPKGVQLAVLSGDPGKAGPFTLRLNMPVGYKIPPHWHSKDENVTVISGVLHLGMGDTMDTAKAHTLKAGGFHNILAKVHHYAFAPGGAVVQIHGVGPFDIVYINPADDPRKAAAK
jgi:hypothetical protein